MRHRPRALHGSEPILVDKMIGSSYDTVRHVASHLTALLKISNNLEAIMDIGGQRTRERVMRRAVQFDTEHKQRILLPTDIPTEHIVDWSVNILTPLGDMYSEDSGMFLTRIVNGSVEISTTLGNAAQLTGGEYVVHLRHEA